MSRSWTGWRSYFPFPDSDEIPHLEKGRGSSDDEPPPGSGGSAAAAIVRTLKNGTEPLPPPEKDGIPLEPGQLPQPPPIVLTDSHIELEHQPSLTTYEITDRAIVASASTESTITAPGLVPDTAADLLKKMNRSGQSPARMPLDVAADFADREEKQSWWGSSVAGDCEKVEI